MYLIVLSLGHDLMSQVNFYIKINYFCGNQRYVKHFFLRILLSQIQLKEVQLLNSIDQLFENSKAFSKHIKLKILNLENNN